MALHLLTRAPDGAAQLQSALTAALTEIGTCSRCRMLSVKDSLCGICQQSHRRESGLLCIVEQITDMVAIENSQQYQGVYFVLHGKLSPLDGIGPHELGFDLLTSLLESQPWQEIILATNATVEGEATAYYLAELARHANIPLTRLAQGVPLGGTLEFVDSQTLARALKTRQEM